MAVFTREEYRRRIAAVQTRLRDARLDAMLCHNLSNICYLTGFQTIASYGYGHYAVIVPVEGEVTLFTSDFESHNVRLHGCVDQVYVYKVLEDAGDGSIALLAELVRKQGFSRARIGYESGPFSLTVDQYARLSRHLPDAALVAVDELIDAEKLVKSADEIAIIRRAAKLTSDGLLAAMRVIAPGVSENEIAATAYDAVVRSGGDCFSLQPIITSGHRSGIPHSTFQGRRIESPDVVFMEVSASLDRYSAPAMRGVFVGKPPDEVRRARQACFDSVAALMRELRPNTNARHAAIEARKAMKLDDADICWHGYYGYSVGITFPPACTDCQSAVGEITELHDFTLRPGMVFHCSTSLRKIGQYGVTIGNTVLITPNGCEVLTDSAPMLATIGEES